MKIFILIALSLLTSLTLANCESKLKSGIQRQLKNSGQIVSVSNIRISNKEKLVVEQGAYINEQMRYDIEVLEGSLQSFSGITRGSGSGCVVRYIQYNPTTLKL